MGDKQMNDRNVVGVDAPQAQIEPIDPLIDYLNFYKNLNEPSFAVLITGEWGSGKTFQVKGALSETEYYYVSLFGLKCDTDVYGAVFNVMYPKKARIKNVGKRADKQGVSAFGFSLPIGSVFSAVVDASIKETVDTSRILILDDLERCELETGVILGIVNRYVEHLKCRVVVIAHDEKLPEAFRVAKEKVFGQTIRVVPKVQDAFDAFAGKLKKDDRLFIEKHRNDLLSIFSESEVGSLRILRQVIDNAVRLKRQLSNEQLSNSTACRSLLRLTSALDFEIKAGRLDRSDIRDRRQKTQMFEYVQIAKDMNKEKKLEPPKIVVAASRYKTIQIDDQSLSDELLIQMLVDGYYNTEAIRACVDKSVYFLKPSDSPPWRTFINFDQLQDADVEAALKSIESQLSGRQVTEIGELLHIFALRLMMVENKIIDDNFQDVVNSCKKYMDDLVKDEKLPTVVRFENNYRSGYDGIGFWATEQYKAEYNEIFAYISISIKKAWLQKFPKLISSLLELVKTDGEAFFEQVCHTANGIGQYNRVPILASIAPKDFVDAWMGSHPKNWQYISAAIKDRSMNARLGTDLEEEGQWLRNVVLLLKEYEKTKSGIAALRIRRTIPQLSLPSLQD
jgi:hypothetical protein